VSNVLFREYRPEDLELCTRLAAQAWPVGKHITKEDRSWRVLEPYVGIGIAWSNWSCVACLDDGEAMGFIFGDIRGLEGSRNIRRTVESEIAAFSGAALGRYGKLENLGPLLWNFMMTELKLLVNRSFADAEIMFLVLDERHRGKGIGKELVERFAKVAREAGSKRMSVYTDEEASNWRFYERYGFKRAGQFYDNWSSYFGRCPCTGIRYVVDL
jgi:GNAT superfamily N-acetyltransferase